MDHCQKHGLREGNNRKIQCDDVLKKLFARDETSVSGVSRILWKHLVGAMDTDENGNIKKLVYKRRKKLDGHSSSTTEDECKGQSPAEMDEHFVYSSDNLKRYNNHFGFKYAKTEDAATRPKRRYRRRKKRDEEGNMIVQKKKRRSGLTRMAYLSEELQAIVGKQGPMPRNVITRGFWEYAQTNGLKTGRIIRCDAKLKTIWGEDVDEIHMYSVQKGLKGHIRSMTKNEEDTYRKEHPNLFSDEDTDEHA